MSPTPTPPPFPPLDLTPLEPTPGARFAEAIEQVNAASTTDLDSLLDGVNGNPFTAPLRALPFRATFGHDSLTITTAPYLIPTLLVVAVLALLVFAYSRVTSPEAQSRREVKRAALHARYTDLIHDKRERAAKARIAERRARDEAREAVTDDVSSGTP